jgi:hypothetical protein
MSLLIAYVLTALFLAGLCAAGALRVRSRRGKTALLVVAGLLCAFGAWLGAADAWTFRDGLPLPGIPRQVSHGLVAAKRFLLGFWLPLLVTLVDLTLIVAAGSRRTESAR